MSGVQPSDPIVLHRYKNNLTLCGGRWYVTGMAPCEASEAARLEGMRTLPLCADVDIEAAASLLGLGKASRCWTRDGFSGDPAKVQGAVVVGAALDAVNIGWKSFLTRTLRDA